MFDLLRLSTNASFNRISAHLRVPLYRNGYLLLFSAGMASGLGVVYWILAARYYAPEEVGLNSAALSAIILLAGISQLSLNGVLIRFIPLAGQATRRLAGTAYLSSIFVAVVVGSLFILNSGHWFAALSFFQTNPLRYGWFILAIIGWCIFSLQDSLLTGLRQTVWIPLENVAFAIGKIALLVLFARLFQRYGILASWTIATVLSLVPVNLLAFSRLIPRHIAATVHQTTPIRLPQLLSYIGGNYLGSLFLLASSTFLPLIVTERAGARANAYFYLPWTITSAVQLIASNMTISLTVEASWDQDHIIAYCKHTLAQCLRIVIPLVIAIAVGAPFILRVFGPGYAAAGAPVLRLLATATVPNILVILYVSIARVQQRVRGIVVVQGLLCILVLSLSYGLLSAVGIIGVGMAVLISQTVVAMLLLLTELRPILWHRS